MKSLLVSVALGAGFLFSVGAYADAPAGSTAQCKDGTYYSGTTHKGACKGHQGVKEWLDKTAATPAAKPTAAPAGSTAQCKDGTYFSGTTHKGACKGHQGVKEWLDKTASTPAAKPAPAPAAPAAPVPVKPAASAAAPAAAPPAAAATHTGPTPASQITQKPGGGPGLVWVNSSSKVYHCQGDEWYGKTKEGSYMTEAAATAAGNHADHGKACSK